MGIDAAMLDQTAQTFRADMWSNAPVDAIDECGIAERRFGPVQSNVIEELADTPSYNTILGAARRDAVARGHLEEAIEWADAWGVDYQIQVGQDSPETAAAEALLNKRGFEQGQGLIRYARNATVPPNLPGIPGLSVWEIGAPGEEAIAGETMALTTAPALGIPSAVGSMMFDLPAQERWRCYTVELEEDLVSFGSMLIRDGVAALGLEGTAAPYRRRGCNLALLRHRILDAAEAGCEVLFADVPSHRRDGAKAAANLIRFGFAPTHRSINWQRPR
jgi:GNAT superfamily N-acetyltransferase